MSSKHIDFVAVFAITLGLLAFSEVRNLQVPVPVNAIRLQNASVNADSCPLGQQIRSQLAHLWHR